MADLSLSAKFLGAFSGSNKGTFEPQRQNAGYLFIEDIGKRYPTGQPTQDDYDDKVTNILALSIDTLRLPTMSTEPIPVGYFNEFVSFSGKSMFDDMDLVVKDFVDIPTAKVLDHWFARVYNPKIGAVGMAYTFKKDAYAVMYATDGSNMRWYKLEGTWISRITRGDIDHNTSDYVRITVTLTVDRVIPSFVEQKDRNLLKSNGAKLPGGNTPVDLSTAIAGLG